MRRAFFLPMLPVAALMLTAAESSPPPEIQKAFGNTIVSTYPDGRTAELWLKPSGDYTAMGRRKDRSSGHWRVSGDKLCLRQSHPLAVPFSYCTAIPSGESWSAKAVTGEPIQVRLVSGRRQAG
jgi:hypothetical protein